MEDGAYIVAAIESFCRSINLDDLRLHTENQLLILNDLKLSKISVDMVTQFDIRPPELCEILDKLGEYYRCFVISIKVKETCYRENHY